MQGRTERFPIKRLAQEDCLIPNPFLAPPSNILIQQTVRLLSHSITNLTFNRGIPLHILLEEEKEEGDGEEEIMEESEMKPARSPQLSKKEGRKRIVKKEVENGNGNNEDGESGGDGKDETIEIQPKPTQKLRLKAKNKVEVSKGTKSKETNFLKGLDLLSKTQKQQQQEEVSEDMEEEEEIIDDSTDEDVKEEAAEEKEEEEDTNKNQEKTEGVQEPNLNISVETSKVTLFEPSVRSFGEKEPNVTQSLHQFSPPSPPSASSPSRFQSAPVSPHSPSEANHIHPRNVNKMSLGFILN